MRLWVRRVLSALVANAVLAVPLAAQTVSGRRLGHGRRPVPPDHPGGDRHPGERADQ